MFSGLSGIFAAYFEFKLFQHKDQIFCGFFEKKSKPLKAVAQKSIFGFFPRKAAKVRRDRQVLIRKTPVFLKLLCNYDHICCDPL